MEKFKIKIFKLLRKKAIKVVTNNLGDIVETKDNIFCYVKKSKLKKDRYNYRIYCNVMDKNNKEICNKYNINKKIIYVFKDLNFDKKVYINGYDNCEILIDNCDFNFNLDLSVNGKCILKNSKINCIGFLSVGSKELILEDLNLENYFKCSDDKLDIIICSDDKLTIKNSNIGKIYDKTKAYLNSNNLSLLNSKISGDDVKLEGKNIFMDQDSLINGRIVNIKSQEYNQLNLMSSEITINSENINCFDNLIYVKKPKDDLVKKRLHLIDTLKLIKEQCEIESNNKIIEIDEILKNKPISKLLKK